MGPLLGWSARIVLLVVQLLYRCQFQIGLPVPKTLLHDYIGQQKLF